MKESLKIRIESIDKKEGSTEKFMYLCGIIGIVDIVLGDLLIVAQIGFQLVDALYAPGVAHPDVGEANLVSLGFTVRRRGLGGSFTSAARLTRALCRGAAAAGYHRQEHNTGQEQRDPLFHSIHFLSISEHNNIKLS